LAAIEAALLIFGEFVGRVFYPTPLLIIFRVAVSSGRNGRPNVDATIAAMRGLA